MRTKFSNETARRVYKERRDFVVIRCKRKTRDFVQSPDQYLIASTKHSAIGNSGVETAGRFAAEYQSAVVVKEVLEVVRFAVEYQLVRPK